MSIGIWQVAIIGVIVVLLFGRGKISELMGDVAKGIKSLKKGLNEEDSEEETATTIEHSETPVAEPAEKKTEAS